MKKDIWLSEEKQKKKSVTPVQRIHKRRKSWLITLIVVLLIGMLMLGFFLAGFIGVKKNTETIDKMQPVGCDLTPEIDVDTGYWTFTTDRTFRVLQLTDIHIGAGALSIQNDKWAISAVETLVRKEKPDLVIVTGDVAYPFPIQSGTFDNKREANLFAELMDKLGVYWTLTFGNHDTEIYSYYDRKDISNLYSQNKWRYCLYQAGPEEVDGYGNSVINVKNNDGLITQSLFLMDSHSYTDGDYFGVLWKYDNIHQNQIDWYGTQIDRLNDLNKSAFGRLSPAKKASYAALYGMTVSDFERTGMIRSSMFFHIPLTECKKAWDEYVANGHKDTNDVQMLFGEAKEEGKVVFCGNNEDNLFEKILEKGSTKAVFFGHDHENYFSLRYKGIQMTYGMSIDYLASLGIEDRTLQRGGTLISYTAGGKIKIEQRRLTDYQ